MKKAVLRAERKYFPAFEFKLSVRSAVSFVCQSLALFLFASIGEFGYALALALFAGLVYARRNILCVAPVFTLACCVFWLKWQTVLYCLAPTVMLICLYALFFKLKRNVPLWSVALAALLGAIPYAACECVFSSAYLSVGVSLLLIAVMTFASGITGYAVFVRGISVRRTVDECMCAGALVAVAGLALSGVRIYGFYLFYTVAAFTLLLLSVCAKPQTTLFCSLLFGIGAAVGFKDAACLAGVALLGAAGVTFSPFTKWSSALAMGAMQALLWLVDAFSGAGWRTLVMTAIGLVACLALPPSLIGRLRDAADDGNRVSYSGIVNRRGRELAAKLSSASDVFYGMSKSMESIATKHGVYSSEKLAAEVANGYCGNCADREVCFSALGGNTQSVLKPMTDAALDRGRATVLDVPPFVSARCTRIHSLISVVNSTAEAYARKREALDGIAMGKKLMAEQFAGMSLILDSLASDCARQVNFADGNVEYVKCELLKHNIVASELVISGDGRHTCVTALVRATDANKTVLPKLLSRMLKTPMAVVRVEDRGERKLVTLEATPVYEVAYGVAERARDGNGVSGDSHSVLCPDSKLRLFAVCDGMGSGKEAYEASRSAVDMIESFYRAGFVGGIVLGLVNKLLRVRSEERFTALDIAVIDAATGGLDVIKSGAAASFIVRRDGFEVINCDKPPAGILDEVVPFTARFQLYDGDALILMSDGVYDALDACGVAEVVDRVGTVNPQTLADELLMRAIDKGAKDDCTVIATRLFCA